MTKKHIKIIGICTIILLVYFLATSLSRDSFSSQYQNFSVDKNKYKLEKMLVLSRHNIRSPLSGAGSVLSEVTNNKWFDWSSKASELSLRGGDLETKMGQYFRKYLVAQGLMDENWIPEYGSVRIYANSMQRTIATAHYFSSGMFPVANIDVEYHEKIDTMDPVFFPKLTFTSEKYEKDVEKQKNELIDLETFQDNLELLEKVLDYDESNYAKKLPKLIASDVKYIFKLNNEPNMEGSLKIAYSASDALKLQYFEEPDEKKAAFGHNISLKDWSSIGEIADVGTHMLFGLPLIARNIAHPLLQEMRSELLNTRRVFTFLCGHDSNIASVLCALDIKEYSLPGVLEKKTPIGGKVVIEKWKNRSNDKEYISVSYIYQSLEQLRDRPLLDLKNPPIKYRLAFKGLKANKDGLYNLEDVINRFEMAINAYDEMLAKYQ